MSQRLRDYVEQAKSPAKTPKTVKQPVNKGPKKDASKGRIKRAEEHTIDATLAELREKLRSCKGDACGRIRERIRNLELRKAKLREGLEFHEPYIGNPDIIKWD